MRVNSSRSWSAKEERKPAGEGKRQMSAGDSRRNKSVPSKMKLDWQGHLRADPLATMQTDEGPLWQTCQYVVSQPRSVDRVD